MRGETRKPILFCRVKTLLSTAFALLWITGQACATIIDTYPDWQGLSTYRWASVAQSFVAPAESTLLSWKFGIAASGGQSAVLFQITPWDPNSGPSGDPLFSREVSWPSAGGNILVNDIDLTLTPGARYAAVVNLQGYLGYSVHYQLNQSSYGLGNASWEIGGIWLYLDGTYNTQFRAEFALVPEPATSLLFACGIAALAICSHKRRARRRPEAG